MSSMAHSSMVSIRRKALSHPKPTLPAFNSIGSASPKSRLGSSRALVGASPNPFLSTADKLTQKWPPPRSLRSVPPGLRADLCSPHRLCELEGAGGLSHGNMEAALRDSQGLGIDWMGQWTLHKWCLLASVTTVFLLGLSCLVFSVLTWYAGESTNRQSCEYDNLSCSWAP
jgi:hypothetical protein